MYIIIYYNEKNHANCAKKTSIIHEMSFQQVHNFFYYSGIPQTLSPSNTFDFEVNLHKEQPAIF